MTNKTLQILLLCFPFVLFAQETLYIYPSGKEVKEKVEASVVRRDTSFTYIFNIKNENFSAQSISDFYLKYRSPIISVQNPEHWLGGKSSVFKNLFMWSSIDSVYNIKPSTSLSGFTYSSTGLPGIDQYYCVGFFKLPVVNEGEAPAFSDIIGGDLLENSKQGFTLTALTPLYPFIPQEFLDTLINYTTRSFDLGWINDEETKTKYENYFRNSKDALVNGDTSAAVSLLQNVLTDVDTDTSSTLTSEAYALLRYNTEYLIEELRN